MNLSNAPYNLGSGKPSEPPEYFRPDDESRCEFGDLLIGAKFWFEKDQWIKVSVSSARNLDADTRHWPTQWYRDFKDNEMVEEIS